MNSQSPLADQTKVTELKSQITTSLRLWQAWEWRNWGYNLALLLAGLLCSGLIAMLALFGLATGAAAVGIIAGMLVSAQRLFRVGDAADFYATVVAEAEDIARALEFRVKTEAEFQSAASDFGTLKRHAAKPPRGSGLAEVLSIGKELSRVDDR